MIDARMPGAERFNTHYERIFLMPTAPKALIVGLDGATFKIIQPLIELGRLPSISRLIERGASGDLRAATPPITPVCWSSFLTGKNPGRHGIFDFVQMREGEYALEFVNGGYRKSETIWKYLNESGYRVGVLNVPFTYPPERVKGYMIAGMDAPVMDRRAAYPHEIFDEIIEKLGGYSLWSIGKKGDTFRRELKTVIDDTAGVCDYLLENHPVEAFMVVYGATDQVQHFYLDDATAKAFADCDEKRLRDDAIAETYSRVDAALGHLLERMDGDTTVILMSDHGATPIKKLLYLDRWLADNGYLVRKVAQGGGGKRRLVGSAVRLAKTVATQYLPRSLQDRILQSGVFSRLRSMRREMVSHMTFSDIDWSATRAFPVGRSGGIRINLEGRDPEGIVPAEDFDRTCEEVSAALLLLRDDDGTQVVSRVHRREEVYEGKHLNKAPDLVISTTDCRYMVRQSDGPDDPVLGTQLGATWGAFDIPGTHDMDGILVLSGPGIKPGTTVSGARLEDVAPTMLYLLGEPVPQEMDGRVLSEIAEEDFLEAHEIRYRAVDADSSIGDESAYSAEEEEIIHERLKGLGYME
jgi:predicted AlkP superfamily phosphohydrolase/phosphomutase